MGATKRSVGTQKTAGEMNLFASGSSRLWGAGRRASSTSSATRKNELVFFVLGGGADPRACLPLAPPTYSADKRLGGLVKQGK